MGFKTPIHVYQEIIMKMINFYLTKNTSDDNEEDDEEEPFQFPW